MLDCGVLLDKWTTIGIVVMLLCIIAMVYIVSSQVQQLSSLDQKLDIVHKKVNGILGIIGIVAEEGRDLIETERAKHAQTTVPLAEELVVEEVKFVDEEVKPTQEEAVAATSEDKDQLVEAEELSQ